MAKNLYKGITTSNYTQTDSLLETDIEIVKADLFNHIWTRKGERVYMPDFGTSIRDLTFEPLDNETISLVRKELKAVVDYDPRVEIIDLHLQPYYEKNTILAKIDLYYVELDVVSDLSLTIEFESN